MGYIKGKILITKISGADIFPNIIVKPITEDEIKQYQDTLLDLVVEWGSLDSL
jgi:hypothetical protein